jgi:hypothetical protein
METVEKLLKVRDLYKKSIEAQIETELRLNKIDADFNRKIKAQKKRMRNALLLADVVDAQRKIKEIETERNKHIRSWYDVLDGVNAKYTKQIDSILGTN